jgi:UDP-N-acetylglucosamine 2-epimerase (non-hydrolysing)
MTVPSAKPLKVMIVVGTRPEIIRLSRVIARLDTAGFHQVLVHTGQNYDYELNEIFFQELAIRKPDYFLNAAGDTPAETISQVIGKIDTVLCAESPDAFLVLGDTNSCLAAIAAKRRKIPVFHMEAGNRCFDQRVPEEINRKIVDHLSDINLCYSELARGYLIREGLPPDRVIKTGSPMHEVLGYYANHITASRILDDLDLVPAQFFLISAHREENIDSEINFPRFMDLLNWLAEYFSIPVVVSTHPRTRRRIDASASCLAANVRLLNPLGFPAYVKLQRNAFAVLSDSGTITEESSILGFPALNIRETHERPEGMDEAAVILTGLSIERVEQGLKCLESQRQKSAIINPVADYMVSNVSEKVARILISYTDYVKRTVWGN